jgi:hypothetical protein
MYTLQTVRRPRLAAALLIALAALPVLVLASHLRSVEEAGVPPRPAQGDVVLHIPIVPAEEVQGYVERLCAVRMTCGPAWRQEDGSLILAPAAGPGVPVAFRVVITPDGVADFKTAEIDPLTYFKGTTVRVTGRVRDRRGRYEVVVHDIDQVAWEDTQKAKGPTREWWLWDGNKD